MITVQDVIGWGPCRDYCEADGETPSPDLIRAAMGGAEALAPAAFLSLEIPEADAFWVLGKWRPDVMRKFVAACGRRSLEREEAEGREVDPRSWAAVVAAEGHVAGTVTDGEMASAWSAARAAWAAWAADWAASDADWAARAAAWAAARAAASDARAAASAVSDADWAAASAASSDVARAGARAASDAASAASDAASAASSDARAAASDARTNEKQWQRETLIRMVEEVGTGEAVNAATSRGQTTRRET